MNQNHPKPMNSDDELKEKLAAIEHERWADWQRWVHSKLEDGGVLPSGLIQRWERQIQLSYDELTREEQLKDLREVDRYWPLISAHIDKKVKEAVVAELERLQGVKFNFDGDISGNHGLVYMYGEDRITELRES